MKGAHMSLAWLRAERGWLLSERDRVADAIAYLRRALRALEGRE